MYTIGYDFCDTFMRCGELEFAVRLATTENVYAPDPSQTKIEATNDGVTLSAHNLIWGGGQEHAHGALRVEVRQEGEGYTVQAQGTHNAECVKSMVLLVRGIDVQTIEFTPNVRESLQETPWGKGWIKARRYPFLGAAMPLVFIQDAQGQEWSALSRDPQLRAKYFASFFDYVSQKQLLVLSHEADARTRGHTLEMPPWQIGRVRDRAAVVLERCHDLENNFGLVPYAQRTDVPGWVKDIQLVAYLHGMHWTGHVFNTFDQMRDALTWLAERIEGKHILAFLPAWDGRYYFDYPLYEPSARLGGAAGLKKLIDHAHQLGIHVVPMLGSNAANMQYLERLGLRDAIMQDGWGREYFLDWVDWDYDLAPEKNGALLNLGHPGYRSYLLERASRLVDEFGVDGIFLDITFWWENDPRYSPYEGTLAWVAEMRRRYPHLLLFAENSYDALWGSFAIWAEDQGPIGHEAALHRYALQTYYLAHPSPGSGSGGVHEGAWHYRGWQWNAPHMSIPALSIVQDTFTTQAAETEKVIAQARNWKFQPPPIAGRTNL